MAVTWTALNAFELPAGSFSAPWQLAIDFIDDMNLLKLVAEGEWEAFPGILPLCGPDGLPGIAVGSGALVLADFRPGALIGKLGGSSAGEAQPPAAEGAAAPPADAFAIGMGCLVPVPADKHGPLFIGFNSRARPLAVKSLKISIWGTTTSA